MVTPEEGEEYIADRAAAKDLAEKYILGKIAATLRSTYWRESGYENSRSEDWDLASTKSKEGWIAVAKQARDLWEGIPR